MCVCECVPLFHYRYFLVLQFLSLTVGTFLYTVVLYSQCRVFSSCYMFCIF